MENVKNLKIVGGVEATPHSWPSIAYLQFYYEFDVIINDITYKDFVVYACGGTLISKNEILTAAQ
jgi:hypothetical protein